jgi:TonB family protein
MRRLMNVAAVACVAAVVTLSAQTDSTVYAPGNGVSLPSVVKQVNPSYTSEAQQQRIEGKVGLSCVVRSDGHVTDITVIRSLDPVYGLDRQAVEAMRQWEFKPGVKDGKAVAVKVAIEMNFTLK